MMPVAPTAWPQPIKTSAQIDRQLPVGHNHPVVDQAPSLPFFAKEAVFIGHDLRSGEGVMEFGQIQFFQRIA